MEKPAPTQFPIHELLARRWSPRAFDERPIEVGKLRSLFEAARWAPSSNNEQPWRFILASTCLSGCFSKPRDIGLNVHDTHRPPTRYWAKLSQPDKHEPARMMNRNGNVF